MWGWWFLPHAYSTLLLGLCRKQVDLGEWQRVLVSWARWWFHLQLLYAMGFHCLSKWTHPLVTCMKLLIWQMVLFSSISVSKNHWKQSLFSAGKVSHTPSLSFLSHNSVLRNRECPSLPQDIQLFHSINDIMLIGLSEPEVATILNVLVRHMFVRGRK